MMTVSRPAAGVLVPADSDVDARLPMGSKLDWASGGAGAVGGVGGGGVRWPYWRMSGGISGSDTGICRSGSGARRARSVLGGPARPMSAVGSEASKVSA